MDPRISSQDKEREKSVAIYEILFSNPAIRYIVLKASLNGLRHSVIFDQLQNYKSWYLIWAKVNIIDDECDWSLPKYCAQWWARCDRLKMLSKAQWRQIFGSSVQAIQTLLNVEIGSVANSDIPQCLKLAMMKLIRRLHSVVQIEDRRNPENGSHSQTKAKNEVHSRQVFNMWTTRLHWQH